MLRILITVEGGVAEVMGFAGDEDFELTIMDQDGDEGTSIDVITNGEREDLRCSNSMLDTFIEDNTITVEEESAE